MDLLDYTYTNTILQNYPREQRYLLAILQDIQRHYNYLPRKSLDMVRDYLDIPLSKLYSMATFYRALSLKPKGKYVIKVCDGTACHIKSSQSIIDEIKKILNIGSGDTTRDGKFSLEMVNCLGSCAASPVMVINDRFFGKVAPSMVKDILSEYEGLEDEMMHLKCGGS
ncbi:MAG: iron-hydrogenase subunit gamma [Thermoanaerobacteraceae bacterium]|jgi:NADH-quinone oxidoreductase subunit E|nr:iron-hydrogenase subunit gamma [Thermoanaerobacteraceae bacterium]